MLRLMRRLAEHRGLVTSQLFDERIFDRAFCRDLARARKTVIIESPYLTEGRAHRFAPIFEKFTKRKVRVRVNTKGPIYHSGEMVARGGGSHRGLAQCWGQGLHLRRSAPSQAGRYRRAYSVGGKHEHTLPRSES